MAEKLNSPEIDKATPRPWRVQGWETYDGDGNAGTFILGGGVEGSASEHLVGAALPQPSLRNRAECDANAALIVTAVNSYDTMLATNKRLREALKPFANQKIEHFEQGHAEIPNKCPACGPILRARAALKEAE